MSPEVITLIGGISAAGIAAVGSITVVLMTRSGQRKERSLTADIIRELVTQIQNPTPPEDEYAVKYQFTGGDARLQQSRVDLTRHIEEVIGAGLSKHSRKTISALAISQHNAALSNPISREKVSQHLEEAEAIYTYLQSKLVRLTPNQYTHHVAFALGIMKHNMLSTIPRLKNP